MIGALLKGCGPHQEDRMARKGLFLAACLTAASLLAAPSLAADKAFAVLKDASGKEVGQVTLTGTPSGVLMSLDLSAVPAGEHAVHVHAVGKCEPPDFKSAGPHFNPDDTKHGLMNPAGPHAGDMPNLHVPSDGKLQIEVLNPTVTLSAESALLDEDGSAIIVHTGADDYKTDPAGNAGDRIACGVVTP
jgi:superoxide dismutase, Cu-Zn family